MQPIYHVELATPLPQDVDSSTLLGRLVLNPHLQATNLNLDGQLVPSPERVGIDADIRREWQFDSCGVWTAKHNFVLGPARAWNALLAHEQGMQAIRNVAVDGTHGWLIVAVYTVNHIITAVDYACVIFRQGSFEIAMRESKWLLFGTEPAPTVESLHATSWFEEHPRTTNALTAVGLGLGTAIATSLAVGGFFGVVGFGAGGVVAGSLAAARWQIAVKKVIAGAPFAGVQPIDGEGLHAGVPSLEGSASVGVSSLREKSLGVRVWDK